MRPLTIACAVLLTMVAGAHAETLPVGGKQDKRIKFVDYDPNDVVLVKTRFGFVMDIKLNDDEEIQSAALGNSAGWDVGPSGSHVLIKPKLPEARTNMVLLTSKGRSYQFEISTSEPPDSKGKKAVEDDAFYKVEFRYPAEAKKRVDDATAVASANDKLDHPVREIRNANYWACGDSAADPDVAFDDGRFTYLRFSGNRAIPTVYTVTDDGTESIANTHVETDSIDTVVVHQLAKRFVFRLGKTVGCLVNKSYDPKGTPNFNGTVTPDVDRVVKKAP